MKLIYQDTCLPDYFGGHRLPVVQVTVTATTTYRELKELLSCTTAIEHLEDIDHDQYLKAVHDLFADIKHRLKDREPMSSVPKMFEGIEELVEDEEEYQDSCLGSVYCYFTLEEED